MSSAFEWVKRYQRLSWLVYNVKKLYFIAHWFERNDQVTNDQSRNEKIDDVDHQMIITMIENRCLNRFISWKIKLISCLTPIMWFINFSASFLMSGDLHKQTLKWINDDSIVYIYIYLIPHLMSDGINNHGDEWHIETLKDVQTSSCLFLDEYLFFNSIIDLM